MNGTYKADGAWLAYQDLGEGLPVVFLHPTPLDSEFWRPVVDRLDGMRAILPDLRGHGRSELGETLPLGEFSLEPSAPTLSMGRLAEDILTLLDRLGLPKAIFVGCSIGGYVLLELWRRAPRRMQGLAFVCSRPQADGAESLSKRASVIRQAREQGVEALFDGMVQSLTGESARRLHPERTAQLRARMTLTPEALAAVQAGLATRPDSVLTVARITAPALAIHGGQDPGVSAEDMAIFQTAPGGCEFYSLPEAGHFAAYEQPERVAARLYDWIAPFRK